MADAIDIRECQNLYIGTSGLSAAYLGTNKLWPQKEYVLPEGYTALEYIENIANGSTSSAACLNTGINAANDIEIYIEYEDNFYYTSTNCSNYIVGARNGTATTVPILMGIGGSVTNNTYNVNCNGSSVQPISNYSRTRGKKYTVDLKYSSTGLNYSVTVDEGTPYTGTLAENITTTGVPIYIFAFNNSGNIKSNTRVYKCIIKKSGQIVRYYLPCISPDNVVGLYDCANTAGTGFSGSSNSSKFYGPGIASYLTFTSTASSTTYIRWRAGSAATVSTISVSTNGGINWSTYASSSASPGTTIATLSTSGATVIVRGNNTSYSNGNGAGVCNKFLITASTANILVEGNIMSMISGANFVNSSTSLLGSSNFSRLFSGCTGIYDTSGLYLPATTLAQYCYYGMFSGCTNMQSAVLKLPAETLSTYCYQYMFRDCRNLTSAPELPATTLPQYCYSYMFQGCTSLTTAPELPATALSQYCCYYMFSGCTSLTTAPSVLPATTLVLYCYRSMFEGCTSLTTAPELPATTLAGSCYYGMFQGCTSLTTAPELPATTLTGSCYRQMFSGCTSLNYIKCLATSVSATYCKTNWVTGVASSGTFVKSSSITTNTWTRGNSGIPTNWTVTNAT